MAADFPRTERFDGPALVAAVRAAGGPDLRPVRAIGEGANGAWEVERQDGSRSVLTWGPPRIDESGPGIADAVDLIAIARRAGIPAPRYEEVVGLPDGSVAVVQEKAFGVPVTVVSEALARNAIDLVERGRGALAGHPLAARVRSLHLRRSGPGYCLHEPMRAAGGRIAALLDTVLAIGHEPGADELAGVDLVHYDFHVGNVLVDPDDPGRITAVVDWGGAGGGSSAFDLVSLALSCGEAVAGLDRVVDEHLEATAPPADVRRFRAHNILRLVDWMIRHDPSRVEHYLAAGERYLR